MAEKAILFDTARCTGCHGCQIACKMWNNIPSSLDHNVNKFSGSLQNPPDLTGWNRVIVTYNEEEGGPKGIKWAFGRRACQHCTNAGCVTVCPAGALFKDKETGMVSHDQSKCIGCQKCQAACPFDVPRYDNGLDTKINKCSGCLDRVKHGMKPACVTTCQPGALDFGDRDEMIKKAQESLARLKERGYEDACIYGIEEMGGLHVIQVLKHGAAMHGAVENPSLPASVTMTEIMKPLAALGMGATVLGLGAMYGLAAGYKRDTLRYNQETEDTINWETGDIVKHGDPQDDRTVMEALTENLPGKKGGHNE